MRGSTRNCKSAHDADINEHPVTVEATGCFIERDQASVKKDIVPLGEAETYPYEAGNGFVKILLFDFISLLVVSLRLSRRLICATKTRLGVGLVK